MFNFFVLYYIDLKQSFIPLTSFKDEYARECKQGLDAVVNIAQSRFTSWRHRKQKVDRLNSGRGMCSAY